MLQQDLQRLTSILISYITCKTTTFNIKNKNFNLMEASISINISQNI